MFAYWISTQLLWRKNVWYWKKKTIPTYYFGNGNSTQKFTDFLTQHEPFKAKFEKIFNNSTENPQTFAKDFYSNVRCSLLHSAETKNGWKIKTYSKNFIPESFVNLDDPNDKTIYRDKFFEVLENYCERYKKSIIDDEKDNNGNSLRDNLCRKLDDLCGIYESDKTWWSWNYNQTKLSFNKSVTASTIFLREFSFSSPTWVTAFVGGE